MTGWVLSYDSKNGIGFLTAESGDRFLVTKDRILASGLEKIVIGQILAFEASADKILRLRPLPLRKGVVLRFYPEKGYGFLASDTDEDIFFMGAGFGPDDEVEFELRRNIRKARVLPYAARVKILQKNKKEVCAIA